MSRKGLVLFFAFSLLICVFSISKMQSAQAQRTPAIGNPVKPQWEYCAIIRSSNMNENDVAVGIATIAYFDTSGYREENVRVQGERVTAPTNGEYQRAAQKALAMTIAQLGRQCWEMIGQLPYNGYFRSGVEEPTALYFKRTKE
jgi:hypothetical protein